MIEHLELGQVLADDGARRVQLENFRPEGAPGRQRELEVRSGGARIKDGLEKARRRGAGTKERNWVPIAQ